MNKKLFFFLGLLLAVGFGGNTFAAGPVVEKMDENDTFENNIFSNPCPGGTDVTASGAIHVTGTIITLPDGTVNATIRESSTGTGTDANGNTYTIGGFELEQAVHDRGAEVSIMRFTSPTGPDFISIDIDRESINNTVEQEKAVCLGN